MRLILLMMWCATIAAVAQEKEVIISADLSLLPISKHTYIHRSFMTLEPYGRFSSNGLIFIEGDEAVVVDTPVSEELTAQLLDYLGVEKITVKAVIVSHFHADALAGLPEFHKRDIPSYGFKLTRALAIGEAAVPPQITFDHTVTIDLGTKKIETGYFGEGHTRDNTVTWIDSEKLLFGGCLVKSLGASKGNIADANLDEWSNTVESVKQKYSDATVIIPGHGNHGTIDLLDYTIKLFQPNLKGG